MSDEEILEKLSKFFKPAEWWSKVILNQNTTVWILSQVFKFKKSKDWMPKKSKTTQNKCFSKLHMHAIEYIDVHFDWIIMNYSCVKGTLKSSDVTSRVNQQSAASYELEYFVLLHATFLLQAQMH